MEDSQEIDRSDWTLGKISVGLASSFSVHNLEEAWRGLPSWASHYLAPLTEVDQRVYGVALLVVTAIAWAIVALAWRRAQDRFVIAIVTVFAAALAMNSLSHVVLSLATNTLMPGVITAAALVLPISIYGLLMLIRKMRCNWRTVLVVLIAGGVLQAVVPVALFSLVDVLI